MAPKLLKRPAASLEPAKRKSGAGAAPADYSRYFPPADAKALVFECDGALVDTLEAHLHAYRRAGEKHGFPFSREALAQSAGRCEEDVLQDLCDDAGLASVDVDAALAYKGEVYRASLKERPARAVAPVLAVVQEGHSRGLPMAVVSSAPHGDVELALSSAGILGYFSVILGREDYCDGKPDPEPYIQAAALLGVKPGSCVGYESTEPGHQAMRAARYLRAEMVTKFADYPHP